MLSDNLGDIEPGGRQGLFHADTRFLSHYRLTLDGVRPVELAVTQDGAGATIFYATNPDLPGIQAGKLSLQRERRLNGHLLTEDITLINYSGQPAKLNLEIEMGADFADVLEVRAVPPAKLTPLAVPAPPGWHHAFAYSRESFACQTLVRWSRPGRLTSDAVNFAIELQPRESWHCRVVVEMVRNDRRNGASSAHEPFTKREKDTHSAIATGRDSQGHNGSGNGTSARSCYRTALDVVYEQALADLQTLRLELPSGETVVGAGIPYFMALFGRDSLLTAYQVLSVDLGVAADVLRALARYQGTVEDPTTDQEPGKIPHEVRQGELALLGDLPHLCYYGSVDATPLFLVLFSEYLRRTGDTQLREDLWPSAEAALAWIDRYGDRDGDGFVEYQRRAPNGLDNQGWKDSHDAIAFADGRSAEGPIALCEVQGYVYDAKLRMAKLYAERGDEAQAVTLRAEARALQQRFHSAFWLPEAGTYALALDGAKCPVDAITSNAGHCLWSGIASPEHATIMAERLLKDDLFSGWGLRTLSTRMGRYNPISYHNGSVWPHDTVLVAAGLLRYGHVEAAHRLLDSIVDAALRFPYHRLPELFAGYPRTRGGSPIPYPDANAPQAWAAGAIVLANELLQQIKRHELALSTITDDAESPRPQENGSPQEDIFVTSGAIDLSARLRPGPQQSFAWRDWVNPC